MIQQRVGDLLEITEDGNYFYVVVLTKIVMFGGNILFAFHNDGEKTDVDQLTPSQDGLNICADLLFPKKEGRVTRLHRFEDVSAFWRTKLVKATNANVPGVKTKFWYISPIDDLTRDIIRVSELTPEYRKAMDSGCHSFDLVARKVLARYTPEQNEHI